LTAQEKLDMQAQFDSDQMWMMVGLVVLGILAFGFLCCIVVGFKSLKLAIDVIDASADFLWETKRIIAVPIFYFFVTLIFFVVWFGALGCVISMNEIKVNPKIPQAKAFDFDSKINYYSFWYMIFGACWIVSWIQYSAQFVI